MGVYYTGLGKCIMTPGVIGGPLYEDKEVFGDSMGVIYMSFRMCMGNLGGHRGSFI